ncbi:DUF805 domain-containing protein [Massilia violaceinigra]|uniref:DUF805 domain-containing protein n=1 Tax=Massilia violaceinigra TaxID=2045208 RepID=A0ABY4A5L6_9BURK|nr:DUF805 domain-containing protein [Massilia violaceinigra]UOD30031.1 DUF805 domain-containing protein [Massilia violaceinigra]
MDNPYTAPQNPINAPAADAGTYQPAMLAMRGRIGRLRYLVYGTVVPMLALLAALGLFMLLPSDSPIGYLIIMATPLSVAMLVAQRRLYDLGRAAGWSTLLLAPVLNIGLAMYLLLAPGDSGLNRFGPAPQANPKEVVLSAYALMLAYALCAVIALSTHEQLEAVIMAAIERAGYVVDAVPPLDDAE